MERSDDMRDHWLAADGYQRLLLKPEMLSEHIRAGPLSRENDAGPLRLQLASPKREKIEEDTPARLAAPCSGAWRANMNIAIYDLDNTITSRATFTRFLLYYAWKTAPVRLAGLPIWLLALIGYRLGFYDRKPLKQFGIAMFIGRKICPDMLAEIVSSFADKIVRNGLQPGALEHIRVDRERGALLVLATAAPEFYARKIGDIMEFNAVIATRHVTTSDGQLTNLILGENCYAGEKLRRVEDWLLEQGIDRKGVHIRFYSDDISDRPTLDFADQGYAINATKRFAAAAAKSNWEVVNFRSSGGAAVS